MDVVASGDEGQLKIEVPDTHFWGMRRERINEGETFFTI